MIVSLRRSVEYIGELGLVGAEAFGAILRLRVHLGDTLTQLREIGVRSLPVVLATILFSAATFAYHLQAIVQNLGMRDTVGGLVGLAIVREVAPVMCAVCVIARCGSAMAAELGTMRVSEQIDALVSLTVRPVEYLVAPRLVATTLMMPVHYAYGLAVGIAGGIAVSWGGGISTGMFLTSLLEGLEPLDVYGGLIKVVAFGILLCLICCTSGLSARGGSRGVGRATTSSVVISLLVVYALNYLLGVCLW